jgi:hypothetical protein
VIAHFQGPARALNAVVYYTIHVKDLVNSTSYIDVCLEDEQLLKDYLQFLDLGMRACKPYKLVNPPGTPSAVGRFAINLSEVVAITVQIPLAAKNPERIVPSALARIESDPRLRDRPQVPTRFSR